MSIIVNSSGQGNKTMGPASYEPILISRKTSTPKKLLNHWLTLAKAGASHIGEPLQEFGITYFLYVKHFKDGSKIELTNNIAWSECYYTKIYYAIDPFKNDIEYNKSKFFWSELPCQQIFNNLRESFHIDHGFIMATQQEEYNEFFHFGGDANNHKLINFYINQEYILKRFILYFKDKFTDLIKQCEKKRIILGPGTNENIEKIFSSQSIKASSEIAESMPINKYYLGEDSKTYLTKREVECLKWHFEGKTACDISVLLNISKRTVEIHLENARHKLNCFKQSHLGYKLSKIIEAL